MFALKDDFEKWKMKNLEMDVSIILGIKEHEHSSHK